MISKKKLIKQLALRIRKYPKLVEMLRKTAHRVSPETVALLNYPVYSKRRWDEEKPHQGLYDIINRNRSSYEADLKSFLSWSKHLSSIPERQPNRSFSTEPCWLNGWLPALDGVTLYGYLVRHKPRLFLEVGSGNSTMFARKAITDHNLDTKIVSIDPCPRAEINEICDEVIRKPVEDLNLEIFDRLEKNDILYIDNSHRVLMNSDATTIFLDVIPRLSPGVLVQIHDITLPYDYPTEWVNRYYSEQYLLAAYLLARGNLFEIVLPNRFVSLDDNLRLVLTPLWEKEEMKNVEAQGCSFWIRML